MRPDKQKERLQTSNESLTRNQCVAKMVDLINIYHSIEHRKGTKEEKDEAKELVMKEIRKLKSNVGTDLSKRCVMFAKNKDEWEAVKESFFR